MRILHLIDPGWPGGGGCPLRTLAEVIARLDGVEHDVLALGTAAHVEAARRCGLEPIGSASPGGRGRAVAAVIRAYEKALGPYDVIHSWTQRAGGVAMMAAPLGRHLVSAMHLAARWHIRPAPHLPLFRVVTPFDSIRRACLSSDFREESVHVVPPAVNGDAIVRNAKIAPDGNAGGRPLVIGMMHSPVEELDANVAMTIAARLALTGVDVRVVVHPDAHRRAQAEMVSHRLGFSHELLIVEDDLAEPWRMVSGLDAAVRIGGRRAGGDVTPTLWAMAAGVPVVAEDSSESREVIEDGVTGRLIPAGDVNAACAALVRLHEDRAAARQLGEAAAGRVRESFGIEALSDGLMAQYEALLRQ